jgi:hypothetical protein
MSDAKPRRAGREAARSNVAAGESVQPEAAPMTIAPEEPDAAAASVPPEPVAAPPRPAPLPAAAGQAAPAARPVEESAEQVEQAADDGWTALAEMQAALARGCEEIALEMTAITRTDIAAATAAATAMLDARTFAEAVEISAGLIRRRADAMIEGSTRLSEIGAQAATAASRPILARLAAGWSGFGHS